MCAQVLIPKDHSSWQSWLPPILIVAGPSCIGFCVTKLTPHAIGPVIATVGSILVTACHIHRMVFKSQATNLLMPVVNQKPHTECVVNMLVGAGLKDSDSGRTTQVFRDHKSIESVKTFIRIGVCGALAGRIPMSIISSAGKASCATSVLFANVWLIQKLFSYNKVRVSRSIYQIISRTIAQVASIWTLPIAFEMVSKTILPLDCRIPYHLISVGISGTLAMGVIDHLTLPIRDQKDAIVGLSTMAALSAGFVEIASPNSSLHRSAETTFIIALGAIGFGCIALALKK